MVIRALDIVDRCYSEDDGIKLYKAIEPKIKQGEKIELSFAGVDTVPSSFINNALIKLLDIVPFDVIKNNLKFVDTTKQINEMIRARFDFEVNKRPKINIETRIAV